MKPKLDMIATISLGANYRLQMATQGLSIKEMAHRTRISYSSVFHTVKDKTPEYEFSWMENIFIERLWRSVKYGCVYLREFETGIQARDEFEAWFNFYNWNRLRSVVDGKRPIFWPSNRQGDMPAIAC